MTGPNVDPNSALYLLALSENTVHGNGPNGEVPTAAADVELSFGERRRLRAMHARAAIVMHYGDNHWSQAQVEGLSSEFGDLGVEVVAVTDAGFRAEQQIADIAKVLAERPDVIVSIPTDVMATASAYRSVVDAGVKLVFMDNVPQGFRSGKDYVSTVAADNMGGGIVSAHLLARALDGRGRVGVVFHDADFFVTQQRVKGFRATISTTYPGMQIAIEQGITGPEFAAHSQVATAAMLRDHPDLVGIWAVWDVPAQGVLAAARAAGRSDLAITTIDLGADVALDLASGGLIKGIAAQRPFDQGVVEAILAGYGLLGKAAPPFVALPTLPVSREQVLGVWDQIYRSPAPTDIVRAAGSGALTTTGGATTPG